MSYSFLKRIVPVLIAVQFIAVAPHAALAKNPPLPATYKHWLEHDVPYLINNDEKAAFLALSTDLERDRFIEHFWAIRNPDPGAPTNEYKDAIYQRIAYANQWFGNKRDNGWRTDQGRAYIVLGPPKQKAPYYQAQQTRPMEIWFYENTNPALPPYFYLLFYQRDIGDDYRLYSPYFDGPDKLVTSVNAVNDRRAAFQLIDKELGREVSRTTLSLIPNEPIDIDNATSSMESDVMLAVYKNLANHPLTKEALKRRAEMLESVSHRTLIDLDVLQITMAPLQDATGMMKLNYAIRLPKPSDFTVGENDKGHYYSIGTQVRVFGPDSKLIFEQNKELSKYINDQEFARMQSRPFGYEGWLPLAPGKYKIEFILSNKLSKLSYRAERDAVVPDPFKAPLQVSPLIPFTQAEALPGYGQAPFSMAGYKFTPQGGTEIAVAPGQNLKFFYQLWTNEAERQLLKDKKLLLEYGYGRLGVAGGAKTIKEELSPEQFDRFGSLGSGKVIDLKDQPAGNYRLSVTISDPSTSQKIFAGMGFRIDPSAGNNPPWDVVDDELIRNVTEGIADYQRGLSYLAQGDAANGERLLQSALQKNAKNDLARGRLADLYYGTHDFAKAAALYRGQLGEQTSEATILLVADSLAKSGDVQAAALWLESALKMRKETKSVDLALASYYQTLGNQQRANELRKSGESLK